MTDVAPRPSLWQRFTRGGWYFVVTIGTAGLFSTVPFWHAATRLQRPRLRGTAVLYALAGAAVGVLSSFITRDARGEAIASDQTLSSVTGVFALAVIAAACVQLRPLRREVYGRPGELPSRSDEVLALAMQGRERREAARELATRDPVLARKLGIGRPDLGRGYDDGGLVDVNTAPAEVIAEVCRIDRAQADAIVAARDRRGSYYNVGELVVDVALPPYDTHQVQERGIVL
ncbi:ComEA family DNA-binding protein [Blastococcus sp. SYSU D00820]